MIQMGTWDNQERNEMSTNEMILHLYHLLNSQMHGSKIFDSQLF
jgi:hypothetical protein